MKAGFVVFCLALVVLVMSPANATADTSPTDPQQEKALIDQVRAQLGSDLADAMVAEQQLRESLRNNAAQQRDVMAQIDALQQKIADLETQIEDAERQEAFLAQRIDAERAQLRELARAIYVSPQSPLVFLGEATSLSDLLTRIADLNAAGARASQVKSQLAMDLTALQDERKKEQAAQAKMIVQRDQLNSELAQLHVLQAQQERSMAELEVKIAQTRYELSLLNRQSSQLAQQITNMLEQQEDAIIAAAMQAVWAQVQLWEESNNVGQLPLSQGHSTKYRFIWPEPSAQISQPFGPSSFWFEPPYGGYAHFHTGIDLVEKFGSPIYAADDGVVALVGSSTSGYGTYVVLAHSGGLNTLYGHLSAALVHVGQVVTQGEPIGLEGSTGNSTGPHLHFELRINQQPVNPSPYLPPGQPSAFKG